MRKILIISSKCFEDSNANGICARDLKKALEKNMNKVFLLGYTGIAGYQTDNKDEFSFFYKREQTNQKFARKIRRIIKPEMDSNLINLYLKEAIKIINKEEIDAVISFYFPLEAEIALMEIKKKYKFITTIAFEVDSEIDVSYNTSRLSVLYNKAFLRFSRKIYNAIDFAVIMNWHNVCFMQNYHKNKCRLVETDLPIFDDDYLPEHNDNLKKETIDFYYTGLLEKEIYSPESFFSFIEANKDKQNWRFHFISRGSCEDDIKKISAIDKRIIQHGFVSKEYLKKSMDDADFFFNHEYKNKPNSISSKLFKYMITGKPIIHFGKKENLTNKSYISKYPLGITCDISNNNYSTINNFVENSYRKRVEYKYLLQTFPYNTFSYNAALINKLIDLLNKHERYTDEKI